MSVPVQAAGTSWRQMSQSVKSIHSATAPLALASARLAAGPATTPRAGRGATAAAAAAKGAASTSRRDGRSAPASPAMLQTSAATRSILDGVADCNSVVRSLLDCNSVVRSVATLCSGCNRLYALHPHLLLPSRCNTSCAALRSGGARGRQLDALARLDRVERHQLHCAEQLFPPASRAS